MNVGILRNATLALLAASAVAGCGHVTAEWPKPSAPSKTIDFSRLVRVSGPSITVGGSSPGVMKPEVK